ncbi:MAG: hypothetical protein K8J08_05680 [Thermoanaerobaculia bacterium]|nr:hypothetical protein [Thermoanaerobaculia bacterium]
MWQALRAELAYLRPWLLGGLGIAVAVMALVSVIFATFGGPPAVAASAIRAMFPLAACLIVAFIVQAYHKDERRALLFLAGPVTPRQLAMVRVLIPLALGICGMLVAALILSVDSAITGSVAFETLQIVGYVGGQLLLYTQMGLLIQEAVVSARQRRRSAALAGWATLFGGAILLTVVTFAALASQGPSTWPSLHGANLIASAILMVVTVRLYTGRTDFTH